MLGSGPQGLGVECPFSPVPFSPPQVGVVSPCILRCPNGQSHFLLTLQVAMPREPLGPPRERGASTEVGCLEAKPSFPCTEARLPENPWRGFLTE